MHVTINGGGTRVSFFFRKTNILTYSNCPAMKRRQSKYQGLPASTMQAKNIGMSYG
jgi:hypothetical protein